MCHNCIIVNRPISFIHTPESKPCSFCLQKAVLQISVPCCLKSTRQKRTTFFLTFFSLLIIINQEETFSFGGEETTLHLKRKKKVIIYYVLLNYLYTVIQRYTRQKRNKTQRERERERESKEKKRKCMNFWLSSIFYTTTFFSLLFVYTTEQKVIHSCRCYGKTCVVL